MIYIKTPQEIATMRQGGKILAYILDLISKEVKAGVSTQELNDYAEELIDKEGGLPAFKGFSGYPASLCTSANHQVVHGIPSAETKLENGDIIGLDLGLIYPAEQGLVTDMAATFAVGKISKPAKKLMEVTRECLERAIQQIKPGNTLGDIGWTIQSLAEKKGYSVVRELVGHGVGRYVHEEPKIPNYGKRGRGEVLKPGMTIALEPMINIGGSAIKIKPDGWTVVTQDGSLSAHFEHTVLVTDYGHEILTCPN